MGYTSSIALVLTGLLTSSVCAKDLYVAPYGHDAPNTKGTIQDPFGSISRATWSSSDVVTAQPGDTIYLRGGAYSSDWVAKGGAEGRPLVIKPFPGEQATFNGMLGVDHSFVVIAGFTISNTSPAPSESCLVVASNEADVVRGVVIAGNNIFNCTGSGIYIGPEENSAKAVFDSILIEGNSVHNTGTYNKQRNAYAGWSPAIYVWKAEKPSTTASDFAVTIRGNAVYENYGEGISLHRSAYAEVVRNRVFDNYSANLYIDRSTHTLHESNLVYSHDVEHYCRDYSEWSLPCWPASGIQIANEFDDGYDFPDHDSSDNVIANNIFIDTRAAFYYGNYKGEIGGTHLDKGLKNAVFSNNTIYNSRSEAVEFVLRIDQGRHANSSLFNNIFVHLPDSSATKLLGAMTGVSFHHNLWYDVSPGSPAYDWQTDVLSNPQLLDPEARNALGRPSVIGQSLLASSPAIASGVAWAEGKTDYLGLARRNPPSLGALEYPLDHLECSRGEILVNGRAFDLSTMVTTESTLTAKGTTVVHAGAEVYFVADDGVRLSPNFRVDLGGVFQARVGGVNCASVVD